MPIRPENKARYPKDWPEIRARILRRADNKCELCGVPNYALGAWIEGKWHDAWPNGSGDHDQPRRGGVFRCVRGESVVTRKVVMVVLTIMHLNHTPEDCADENLKAGCQRCHNLYDGPMRRAGIRARAAAQGTGDLFE